MVLPYPLVYSIFTFRFFIILRMRNPPFMIQIFVLWMIGKNKHASIYWSWSNKRFLFIDQLRLQSMSHMLEVAWEWMASIQHPRCSLCEWVLKFATVYSTGLRHIKKTKQSRKKIYSLLFLKRRSLRFPKLHGCAIFYPIYGMFNCFTFRLVYSFTWIYKYIKWV